MGISQKRLRYYLLGSFSLIILLIANNAAAQVNAVEFGKNRVQYGKMNWRYYQTRNFNVYFTQNGLALAKYAAQLAEKELPGLEDFVEYGSQRRINIIVYNSFNDLQQSNIGLGIDWQNTGGVTKFVNNKMIVYFDGNHANLRIQIRQGIAKTLMDNLLFGDNLGEFASNQALLDLPAWLTDGYVRYAAENWSPELDDKLKSALLSGKYKSFYQFAFDQPDLAGHAFWRFIADNYRKDNVTYFIYLARIYKSVNSASKKVAKKKFKDVLKEFMEKEEEKYYKDLKGRRNAPRGSVVALEDVNKDLDYYRFQANPNPRNSTYAVVRYKKGRYRVELEDFGMKRRILLASGTIDNQNEINPNYPQLAWDPKGTKIVVVYMKENQIRMFEYDLIKRLKKSKQALPEEFQQINDVKYMLNENTLLLSAVKNGYSDIFVYKIDDQSVQQITNDVYDDLDPTFVAFPGKTGIIFSSNRPTGNALNSDTALPSNNRFNIFLVDNWNKSDFRQITKLTDVKYGNARYPMQYNTSHFTFVNDEMGIANRYAGFFTTRRAGVDTVYTVGDEFLRNPDPAELDSTLKVWNKEAPDSMAVMSVTSDSAYSFPITNYQSGLQETRIAGDKGQVTEVRQEGDLKMLYKLRVNEDALKKRNTTIRPTEYMKKVIDQARASKGEATIYQPQVVEPANKAADVFQSEFENEKPDSGRVVEVQEAAPVLSPVLSKAKLFDYRLKFSTMYSVSGFNNSVMMTRWQPYGGGSGPVYMTNGSSNLNGMIRLGIADLFEDVKFIGGIRLGLNLSDRDVMFSYQNLRRRFDWGLTYYRSTVSDFKQPNATIPNNRLVSDLYQFNIAYPFDRVRSVRATVAYRLDRTVYKTDVQLNNPSEGLKMPDDTLHAVLSHLEYVYDNSLSKALNIWNGLRYKVFTDINTGLNPGKQGRVTFNVGADIRYYYPIYRNFIWAGRAAADFSWGTDKMIFYLGGTDGWINPKFNNSNPPATNDYTYQTLAVNMRGYQQNVANGNNAIVLNSEFRLPVFTTLLSRPINNAFIRNFQLTQFVDLGTAWTGKYNALSRPGMVYVPVIDGEPVVNPQIIARVNSSGVGPFAGGYGFGARSTLLGYFLKVDAGWPMSGFFSGKPIWYFSLGLDF